MIRHTQAVRRGCKTAHLVADLPFLTYNTSIRDAVYHAGLLLKAGADSVKLEGGVHFAQIISAIVKAGIPVMGHIGLTPQTISALGGFKAQGRDKASALALLDDAAAVEEAGAFSMVLEAVPAELGKVISKRLAIPVIGIGAGPDTDGQVLVYHDIMGLYDRFVPKFVRQFAKLRPNILQAMQEYRDAVQAGAFPASEHCFFLNEAAKTSLQDVLEDQRLQTKD
jgi:3-methyl-2-oxobutanoate hydroxymethyltransferase